MEHSRYWINQFPYCFPSPPFGLSFHLIEDWAELTDHSIPFLLWYSNFLNIFIPLQMRKNGIFFLPEVIFYKNIFSGQKNSSAQCAHAHFFFFCTINTFKESLPLSFIIGLSKISNIGEPARACWEHRGSLQGGQSSPSGHSFLQEAPWKSTLGQFPCVLTLQSFFPLHRCLHSERKWFRNTLRQSFF